MELAISNNEFSELIGNIYEGALTGDWQPVLTQMMEYTNSNKTFFILQKLGCKSPFILEMRTNFDYPPSAMIHYQENIDLDPCYQTTKLLTEGECHYCNEYVDLNQYETDEYFSKTFVPMKTFHVLVGVLCRDGAHESVVAVNRDKGEPNYSEQDINLFKLVTPHFSRAMHIFKELRLYKDYSNISKSVLDQQDKAILVCDVSGTIVVSNEFAESHLSGESVIKIIENKLRIEVPILQQQLEHYIQQCCCLAYTDIGVQETILIEAQNHDNSLVTVAPVLNKNKLNNISVPCCLITIKYQASINWENISKEFELTKKELLLLKEIHKKKKLNELTETFNVSYNTLRTHLQAIFRKTQVNSQTELMIKINLF